MKTINIVLLVILIIIAVASILYLILAPQSKSNFINNSKNIDKFIVPSKTILAYNYHKNLAIPILDLGNTNYLHERRLPIPKKIYRSWCESKVEKLCGGREPLHTAMQITQKNLPDWEQIVYGDYEINRFILKEFGKNHDVTKAYNLINPKYGAARADLFRYLIIYKFGGLYLDMKSGVISKDFPKMPNDMDMWTSGGGSAYKHLFPNIPGEYQNWYIYARKGSPILKDIICRVVHNIIISANNLLNFNDLTINVLEKDTLPSPKGITITVTGPVAMTLAILHSKYSNTVYSNKEINNTIIYNYAKVHYYDLGKDHYSFQTKPLVKHKTNVHYIPKVVYFTYNDLESIPQYVKYNIYKYCSGYDIKIYDDKMCTEFLGKYYNQDAVNIFNNMKSGAHKADFWRFCILYIFGGYYFDIKTEFVQHIDQIFDSKLPNTWYTALTCPGGKPELNCPNMWIYNGIIVTPAKNPILLKEIQYMYKNPVPSGYHLYIKNLYKILSENSIDKLKIGDNFLKNKWNCILFQEVYSKCSDNYNTCIKDRYDFDSIIKNSNGEKIFNTRYKDFPWS